MNIKFQLSIFQIKNPMGNSFDRWVAEWMPDYVDFNEPTKEAIQWLYNQGYKSYPPKTDVEKYIMIELPLGKGWENVLSRFWPDQIYLCCVNQQNVMKVWLKFDHFEDCPYIVSEDIFLYYVKKVFGIYGWELVSKPVVFSTSTPVFIGDCLREQMIFGISKMIQLLVMDTKTKKYCAISNNILHYGVCQGLE